MHIDLAVHGESSFVNDNEVPQKIYISLGTGYQPSVNLIWMILLNVAEGNLAPFCLALVSLGCSKICCLTAAMFSSDRPVRLLSEFLLLRLRLVPCSWYFLTFAQMVLAAGGSRSGKRSLKVSQVCCKLRVWVHKRARLEDSLLE